jgi:hypothetical protein
VISEHLQDPNTLTFDFRCMGPRACQHQRRMLDKSKPRNSFLLDPTLVGARSSRQKTQFLPLGILCRPNGRRCELAWRAGFHSTCEPHPHFEQSCSRWWEAPHFGIDRPTRDKIFLWSAHDDGLVRSLSSNFDFLGILDEWNAHELIC